MSRASLRGWVWDDKVESQMPTLRYLVAGAGLAIATMLLFYQLELVPSMQWSEAPSAPDKTRAQPFTGYSTPNNGLTGRTGTTSGSRTMQQPTTPAPDGVDSAVAGGKHYQAIDDSCYELDKQVRITVAAPRRLETCVKAEFILRSNGEDLRPYCPLAQLELNCEIDMTELSSDGDRAGLEGLRRVRKTVYSHPLPGESTDLILEFFPDGSTDYCEVRIVPLSESVVFHGELEFAYDVEPFSPKGGVFCFQCKPMLHRDIPDASSFALWHDGLWVWDWDLDTVLASGEETMVWVRPLPWVKRMFEESVLRDIQFNGILTSENTIEAAPVSLVWDEAVGGYAVYLSTRDFGSFTLEVTMNFVFGGSAYLSGDPTPICTSSHMRHEFSECDKRRSEVIGSGTAILFVDSQGDSQGDQLFINNKSSHCTDVHSPGRWVRLDTRYDCYPPYCTGDRFFSLVNSMSWQGHVFDHVWVPYDCHFHFYNEEDFTYCTKEMDISWIHVMGDSLPREVAAYLMSIFGSPDTNKFETADQILGDTGIRISFQSWQDIILSGPPLTRGSENYRYEQFIVTMLDHYNFLHRDTSTMIEDVNAALSLPALRGSPEVFIMNPATAYSIFKQTETSYKDFLKKILRQTKEMCTTGTDGRPPVRCIWYGNPYIFAAAHDGTDFLTESRNERYKELTISEVEANGYVYYDPILITRSRPEESWDGLHYLRGYEEWNGHVASNNIQLLLNLLFGDCKGPE